MLLFHILKNELSVISFGHGFIKFSANSDRNDVLRLKKTLDALTNINWNIDFILDDQAKSYGQKEADMIKVEKEKTKSHPLVQEVLSAFGGVEVSEIKIKG